MRAGVVVGCLGFVLAASHAAAGQAPPQAGSAPTPSIRAVRVSQPITVDGRLDEAFYSTTPPVSDFIQIEPREGVPATEKTEVWLAFDEDSVYVAFRCWESEPGRRVAKEMRRDHVSIWNGDDIVAFFFDTFNDRRNGFEFAINAIGGRQDAQTSNERQWNGDWNTVWNFRAGQFDGGWVVEAAIPFKSLRYAPGPDQTWGFNALRTNRWKNELSFLSPPPKSRGQAGLHMASRAASLVGLSAPPGGRNIEAKPYAIGNASGSTRPTGGFGSKTTGTVGADVKYGVTQNLTADITINTDFAQVEADTQQVNLTRFSLFFPEKREFFLENQGMFTFGTNQQGGGGDTPVLFYSRRIGLERNQAVPIDAGGRFTGRLGRYTFGVLDIRARESADAGTPATNFSVVRVRRDILRRSSVGLLMTGRDASGAAASDNAAYGVDGTFAFFANLNVNTYWARTSSRGLRGSDVSYRGQIDYTGDRYGVQAERLVIGDAFSPGVGFVRRPDLRKTYGQARFSPRPSGSRLVRKYSYTGSIGYYENTDGRLESRDGQGEFAIEFQNADRFTANYTNSYEFLPLPFRIVPGVTLPVGDYHFDQGTVSFSRSTQQRIAGTVSLGGGTFYNGHRTTAGVSGGRVNVTPRVSVEPSYSINRVSLVQGDFTTHLLAARLTFTPTPFMFASAFVQYNSTNHAVSSNVRLRWEYRPGSELFVVYNEERDTRTPRFPDLANRALIIKVNRLLRF